MSSQAHYPSIPSVSDSRTPTKGFQDTKSFSPRALVSTTCKNSEELMTDTAGSMLTGSSTGGCKSGGGLALPPNLRKMHGTGSKKRRAFSFNGPLSLPSGQEKIPHELVSSPKPVYETQNAHSYFSPIIRDVEPFPTLPFPSPPKSAPDGRGRDNVSEHRWAPISNVMALLPPTPSKELATFGKLALQSPMLSSSPGSSFSACPHRSATESNIGIGFSNVNATPPRFKHSPSGQFRSSPPENLALQSPMLSSSPGTSFSAVPHRSATESNIGVGFSNVDATPSRFKHSPSGQFGFSPPGNLALQSPKVSSSPGSSFSAVPHRCATESNIGVGFSNIDATPSRFKSSPSGQFGSSPPGQFRSSPPGQFGSSPPGQFRSSPSGQFRSSPPVQFRSSPPGQFRSSPPGQFRSSPPGQFRSSPLGQFRSSPPGQFGSSPPGQFRSSPRQVRLTIISPSPSGNNRSSGSRMKPESFSTNQESVKKCTSFLPPRWKTANNDDVLTTDIPLEQFEDKTNTELAGISMKKYASEMNNLRVRSSITSKPADSSLKKCGQRQDIFTHQSELPRTISAGGDKAPSPSSQFEDKTNTELAGISMKKYASEMHNLRVRSSITSKPADSSLTKFGQRHDIFTNQSDLPRTISAGGDRAPSRNSQSSDESVLTDGSGDEGDWFFLSKPAPRKKDEIMRNTSSKKPRQSELLPTVGTSGLQQANFGFLPISRSLMSFSSNSLQGMSVIHEKKALPSLSPGAMELPGQQETSLTTSDLPLSYNAVKRISSEISLGLVLEGVPLFDECNSRDMITPPVLSITPTNPPLLRQQRNFTIL